MARNASVRSRTGATRVTLEVGGKRVFASAIDWPGWCRSGKGEEGAMAALAAAAPRYAAVAQVAGIPFPKDAAARLEVTERVPGSATTDFGAPGAHGPSDSEPLSRAEGDRLCALVSACWAAFDRVVKTAPASLRKGPRGGGRDRDEIVDHVLGAEVAYTPKLGLKLRQPKRTDRAGITAQRDAILDAFRAGLDGQPPVEKGWPVRYAARRIAWHALDHAWEIEDRTP
jgi:hypothetical protein